METRFPTAPPTDPLPSLRRAIPPGPTPKAATPGITADTLHLPSASLQAPRLNSADAAAAATQQATQQAAHGTQDEMVQSLYDWSNLTPERLHELLN